MAAPTVDAVASDNILDVNISAWVHTINASATALVVAVVWRESTISPDGLYLAYVQCAGVDLTFHSVVTTSTTKVEYWYLTSPTTGASVALTAEWYDATTGLPPLFGAVSANLWSISLLSSDTTSGIPVQANRTRSGRMEQRQVIGSGISPSRVTDAITSINTQGATGTNNLLLDAIGIENTTSTAPTATVDAAQTQRHNSSFTGADSIGVRTAGSSRGVDALGNKIPMRWDTNGYFEFAQSVMEMKGT